MTGRRSTCVTSPSAIRGLGCLTSAMPLLTTPSLSHLVPQRFDREPVVANRRGCQDVFVVEGGRMANPSPWPILHAERSALLEDLENLNDNQWATRSLCPAWSVRVVFGHMTATATMPPAKCVSGWA